MRPGPQAAARRRLNPALRDAVRLADSTSSMLAIIAGYPHSSGLSAQLHADRVRATPANLARLARVAAAVGFGGPLLLDEPGAGS